MMNAIDKAIDFFGNQDKLAEAVKVTQSAVSQMKKRGTVTPEIAKRIEEATGGAVTRAELRPDIFG